MSGLINRKQRRLKGFSLIEVILSIALFSLIITVFAGAIIYGQENSLLAGKRARAVFIAVEGLEAVRNIRDSDFSMLADGNYGLAIDNGQWVLTDKPDVSDIFTRNITITGIDDKLKHITSNVQWMQNLQRDGNISLETYLGDWKPSP